MASKADSSVRDMFKFPWSGVIKPEPLMDCPEDGSDSHLVRHADSAMTPQDIKDESTTPVLDNVMEEHQGYQQSTNVRMKQEPPDDYLKYPTPLWSVKAEDGQIAATHEDLSHTGDGIKLEQTSLAEGIGMCTNTTIGKITASPDHVESVKFEGYEIKCPFPDISNLKPAVPVALYRCQTEEMTIPDEHNMAAGKLKSPLPVEKHCSGTHVDVTCACRPTGEKAYCKYGSTCQPTVDHCVRKIIGENPFKCTLCDYRSVCNSNLVTHMTTHTREKPFKCSMCDYRSATKNNLIKHKRTHTGEKPFKCSVCDYRSSNRSNLVSHMSTHTGEKPFKCSLCNYKTSWNSSLVNHMRTHTGVKPIECSLCDYRSNWNSSIVRHMKTHTGEKPFNCSFCDHRFGSNSDLVLHMRVHTGAELFGCCLCNYKCAKSCSLARHMKKHTKH